MIVEYLRYTVSESDGEAFVRAYEKASIPLMRSPFCTSFELCRCVEEPSIYVLRIVWTSADDHLQRFRKSGEFAEFLRHVRPYIERLDEMRHYERLLHAPPDQGPA